MPTAQGLDVEKGEDFIVFDELEGGDVSWGLFSAICLFLWLGKTWDGCIPLMILQKIQLAAILNVLADRRYVDREYLNSCSWI